MVMGLKVEGRKGSDVTVRPMPVSSSVGYEIHEFLAWEALLLDHRRYGEWSALLSKDLVYRSPPGLFSDAPEPARPPQINPPQESDYDFILAHVRELECQLPATTAAAPSFHVHRLITNVIVSPAHCSKEFVVTSYVLLTCARDNEPEGRLLTVERNDCLRRRSTSYQIARREVRLAQIPPEMRHLVSFL
jgi:3-phenylpropionate/cinnamic acid dioxygenase small subunit